MFIICRHVTRCSCGTCNLERRKYHRTSLLYHMPLGPYPEIVLAYTAGIIDGEGYIGIMHHKRKTRSSSYERVLKVGNTNEHLIDWLVHMYGGHKETVNQKGSRKPSWNWILWGEKAVDLLTQIYPYSIIKKSQIDVFLRFQRRLLTTQIKAYQEIHELNKRGI